tara:strand:- start:1033 stop:1242 length:210 start_codon:yes stop_codon:yes gene_type:complete
MYNVGGRIMRGQRIATHPRRDICWWCGGKLIWQSDFDKEDVYGEGKGLVTYLQCSECNASVEYISQEEE